MVEKNKNESFYIRSVQAADIYKDNNSSASDEQKRLRYRKAVMNNSIFTRYARKHGIRIDHNNLCSDFIILRFDYDVLDNKNGTYHNLCSAKTLRERYYRDGVTVTWRQYDKDGSEIIGKRETIKYLMLMRSAGKAKAGQCIFVRDSLHKKFRDYLTMGLWERMPDETGAIKYLMLMRSAGKAKAGQCIFVRDSLHKKFRDYLTMGLWERMPDETGAKIVELSAYAPLIAATAINQIQIPINNIFVVKDEEVFCDKKAYIVKSGDYRADKRVIDYDAVEKIINQMGYTFYKTVQKKYPLYRIIRKTKSELMDIGLDLSELPVKTIDDIQHKVIVDRTSNDVPISNTLWDGMGLIDESMFPPDMEGFIYCRSHFFKSCLFRGGIQQYFRDYYGANYDKSYAVDMFGRRIRVTDIKVIVTDNSLKWLKFKELMGKNGTQEYAFRYWQNIMVKDGEIFDIVKTAHSSKYGDLQRSSFQINNTLLTTDKEQLRRIARTSIDFCNKLKTDDEAYIDFLKVSGAERHSINNVLAALYRRNGDIVKWDYFKSKRTAKISELKRNRLMQGKLFQTGDNLTICGNVIALLKKVTGENFMDEGCFSLQENAIQCYTERFADGERLAGFRSPHNSPNNIVSLQNVYPQTLRRYFPKLGSNVIVINGIQTDIQSRANGQDLDTDSLYVTNQTDIVELARRYFPKLGSNVIVINGIQTDIQSRANGQDLDTDSLYVTNQTDIVELAEKAYIEYPTIVNAIAYKKNDGYDKSAKSYALMDSSIADGQMAVGVTSNLAQLALSYWFDSGCKDWELEDIFVICSVLAQVAIDSAKRSFDINLNAEMKRIQSMLCMQKKHPYPLFYAAVQQYKNKLEHRKNQKIPQNQISYYNCPMDILYKLIDREVLDMRKNRAINGDVVTRISAFMDTKIDNIKADRKQYKKIIGIIDEYVKNCKIAGDESEQMQIYFDDCARKLKNLNIRKETMKMLIIYAFKAGNEHIRDSILVTLYDKDTQGILECFYEKSPQKSLGLQ